MLEGEVVTQINKKKSIGKIKTMIIYSTIKKPREDFHN